MKYLFVFILLTVVTISCQKKSVQNEVTSQNAPKISNISQNIPNMVSVKQQNSAQNQDFTDEYEPENFADELKIGKRKSNRVEISTYKKGEELFVKTKFYAKLQSQWILKNEFEIEKIGELPIEPEIKDFNGDGFKDITFVSGIAARGANEIRDLFIYNSRNNELTHIKNSINYPNLGYNPLLKCLDAWIFTGSTETVFLKLEGDKLVEFASVEDGMTDRFIYIIDRNGNERLLRREKRKDDGFDRYINFNPVQTYKN